MKPPPPPKDYSPFVRGLAVFLNGFLVALSIGFALALLYVIPMLIRAGWEAGKP